MVKNIFSPIFLFFLSVFCSCNKNQIEEVHQDRKDNIFLAWNNVVSIVTDSMPQIKFGQTILNVIDDYLIIVDNKSKDKWIHVMNLNDFSYVKSVLPKGHAKGECTQIFSAFTDAPNRCLYVLDMATIMYKINIDSILASETYIPQSAYEMEYSRKTSQTEIIKYPLAIVSTAERIGNSDYNQNIAKFNLETGEFQVFDYTHPDAQHKRIRVIASDTYAGCAALYQNRDLITLYDLNGYVKRNIYGPDWTPDNKLKLHYFVNAVYAGDKIAALYSGRDHVKEYYPQKILIFDIDGNYLKTLDMQGHELGNSFCYDSKRNRLIFSTDEHDLAYYQL